jgi:nitrogen regulatory protein PII 1
MDVVKEKAYTGHFGDGKVFVIPVDEVMTVRTGLKGL